jgi:glycogen debranching enzyme
MAAAICEARRRRESSVERGCRSTAGATQRAAEQIPDHYVEAQTSLVDRALRTLKHGDAFAVTDAHGDIGLVPESPEGLFFQDTRYLSFFELRLEGRRPLLLASVLQDDNAALSVDLTNPDIALDAESGLPRDIIAMHRTKFLWSDACYEVSAFATTTAAAGASSSSFVSMPIFMTSSRSGA